MGFKLHRAACALTLAGLAGGAWANCDDIVNNYSYYAASGLADYAGNQVAVSPECFGGGPTTSQVQINGTMFQQAQAISNVLAARQSANGPLPKLAMRQTGMAAGAQDGRLNLWGNPGNTDSRQGYSTAAFGTNGTAMNDMSIFNTILGIDYALAPALVTGVSLAIDQGRGSGGNTDPTFAINSIRSDGYVLAPYVGWQISNELALDASVGFGNGQIKTHTTNSVDSSRWYGAANLNYSRWLNNLQLSGRASLMHGEERYDDIVVSGVSKPNTSAHNTLDQGRLMVQAGYWMNGLMPYASITYINDLRRATTQFGAINNPIGRDAWEWKLGLNLFVLSSGITGNIAYTQEEGRSYQKSNNVTASLNVRF